MINTTNSVFVWNCRGAASQVFYRFLKQYLDIHNPDIVVILETRVDPARLQRTLGLLGFDGYDFCNVQGYAGGIRVAWKRHNIRIDVLRKEFQFMHLQVISQGRHRWFFTPVYASPNENTRRELWHELKEVGDNMNGAWLVAGDMNNVAFGYEKKGGIPVSQ